MRESGVGMRLQDVAENYDRAANWYDAGTELLFGRVLGIERLRGHTIDLLGDIQGRTVLDLGCGTGRNFCLLRSRVGEEGRVIGVDYSQGMLDQARMRIHREGWTNVEIVRDDVATLERIVEPVDAAVSAWCMSIVHDLDGALHRTLDLLREGGRLAILDFDRARPDRGPLRVLYPIYSRALRWAGIDSAEDLDEAQLRAKWRAARPILDSRLEGLREQRHLQGMGLILSGSVPHSKERS